MVISANTLFHFTKDFSTLLSILKTKFYPRLCKERCLWEKSEDFIFAIPMVCFCDIPLSCISEHAAKYGGYAIGLKKLGLLTRVLAQFYMSMITHFLLINVKRLFVGPLI